MPYIQINTSCVITQRQETEMKAQIGQAIELIPGMKEAYLMLRFEGGCRLYFGGESDCAFLEVRRFGHVPADAAQALTARLSAIVAAITGISPDRTYVQYLEAPYWGCHGHNF